VDDLPGIDEHDFVGDLLEWGNPVAPFVESMRTILWAGDAPDVGHLVYVAGAGAIALIVGMLVFRRMERDLAVVL
jgi:ABC-type polysaccharide/polyol phosphate export permease